MGIITGYILLALIILISFKFITKRLHNNSLDRIIMKLHKPMVYIAAVIAIVHGILVLQVFATRPLFLYVGGIMMIVVGVATCLVHTYRSKLGKSWIRWHRIMVLILFALTASHMIVYFVDFASYQNAIKDVTITDIDVTSVPDGEYIGCYDAGYIYAKVKVEIKKGTIVDIKLLQHDNERGKQAEKIVDQIQNEQTICVDTVSGATNSSKVIQQAIYNALTNN